MDSLGHLRIVSTLHEDHKDGGWLTVELYALCSHKAC